MAKRHHVPQHEFIHFLDHSAARKCEDEKAGEKLTQDLASAEELDMDPFFGNLPGLGLCQFPAISPEVALHLHEDRLFHSAIDGEAFHHPPEGVLPGEVTDLMEKVMPAARNEQYVEGNVDLIAPRTSGISAAKAKRDQRQAGRNAETRERRMDIPLDRDNQPAVSAPPGESERIRIVLKLRDAVDRLTDGVLEYVTEVIDAIGIELAHEVRNRFGE